MARALQDGGTRPPKAHAAAAAPFAGLSAALLARSVTEKGTLREALVSALEAREEAPDA